MEKITWGWLIAFYLFFGGISAGAAVLHGYNGLTKKFNQNISKASAFLAPFPVMFGLLLLIFDLHRPTKFYLLLFNFNLNSVMAWGVILVTVFSVVSLITIYMAWRNKETGVALAVANIVCGLGLAGYTGLLLSAISHNPVWGTPVLPILFLVSAISTGLAGTLLVSSLIPSLKVEESTIKKLGKTDMLLILAEVIVLSVLVLGWVYTAQGSTVLDALLFGSYALQFWVGFVLIGLIIPFIMLMLEVQGKLHFKGSTLMVASLVLVGGAILRAIIVFSGQTIF